MDSPFAIWTFGEDGSGSSAATVPVSSYLGRMEERVDGRVVVMVVRARLQQGCSCHQGEPGQEGDGSLKRSCEWN